MTHTAQLRRVHRVFWTLLLITTIGATWLWDQATGTPLVAGAASPALDLLAGSVVAIGVILLTRMVWRLSRYDARGAQR